LLAFAAYRGRVRPRDTSVVMDEWQARRINEPEATSFEIFFKKRWIKNTSGGLTLIVLFENHTKPSEHSLTLNVTDDPEKMVLGFLVPLCIQQTRHNICNIYCYRSMSCPFIIMKTSHVQNLFP